MNQTNTHPQKHVLVEHVSDDIRATKQSTLERQKVVLTAQAMADLLTGDSFDPNSSFDAKYFTNGAPDFNKVTDASIRWVEWPYVNGPEGIQIPGFLYTFVELPSGRLTWLSDNNVTREHDGDLALRQIFYIDEQYGEIEAFTRVGQRVNNVWSFSPYWHRMDGKIVRIYVGQEQVDAGLIRTANLRPDVIYEMHCGGNTITLPDADTLRLGATIAFEQYANPNENGTPWTNTVKSTEMQSTGTTETYETVLVPPLKHGRTSEADIDAGMWYNDVTQASVYKFDCIDREGQGFTRGGRTYLRTWSLDIDPEAITAMADITAMLGAHTDQKIDDIVRYGDRYQSTDSAATKAAKKAVTLVTSRQATMNGLIKFSIKFNANTIGNLSNDFRLRIYRYNENTDTTITSHFEYTLTTDTQPSLYKKYYLKNGTTYSLASGTGYIDSFVDGVQYYERSVQWYEAMPCAKWVYSNNTTSKNADFLGKTDGAYSRTAFAWATKVSDPENVGLVGYIKAYRNDTIMVSITSSDHYADALIVSPSVEFYPDPHDTYLSRLQLDNTSIFPRWLAESTTPYEKKDQVAGSYALTEAVRLIINQLQGKGLFWGPIPVKLDSDESMDELTNTGIYYVTQATVNCSKPVANSAHSIIMVFASERYVAEQLEPPANGASTFYGTIHQVMFAATTTAAHTNTEQGRQSIYWRHGYRTSPTAKVTWVEWSCTMPQHRVKIIDCTNGRTMVTLDHDDLAYENMHYVIVGNGADLITVTLPQAFIYPHATFQIEAVNAKIRLVQQDPTAMPIEMIADTAAFWNFEAVTATTTSLWSSDNFRYFTKSGATYVEVSYTASSVVGTTYYRQKFKSEATTKYNQVVFYSETAWPAYQLYERTTTATGETEFVPVDMSSGSPTIGKLYYAKTYSFLLNSTDEVGTAYCFTYEKSPYPYLNLSTPNTEPAGYALRDRKYCYQANTDQVVSIDLNSVTGDTTRSPAYGTDAAKRYISDRMLYPIESDGRAWYLIVAS